LGRGLRPGFPLSPLLFNTCIEELIREAAEDLEQGKSLKGWRKIDQGIEICV